MEARKSFHVEGIAAGRALAAVAVVGKLLHGLLVPAVVVVGATHDAVHLGAVFLAGVGGQVVLCYDFGLVIFLLGQVDFGDVVGHQCLVLPVVLQGEEALQGLVVALLGVADVGEVVGAVGVIAAADGAQGFEPGGCLLQVAHLEVAGSQAVGHVVTLLVAQQVEARGVEHGQRFVVFLVEEVG